MASLYHILVSKWCGEWSGVFGGALARDKKHMVYLQVSYRIFFLCVCVNVFLKKRNNFLVKMTSE